MLSLLRRSEVGPKPNSAKSSDVFADDGGAPRATRQLTELIADFSAQSAALGQESAEVRGAVEDAARSAKLTVDAVHSLAQRLNEVEQAQESIDAETRGAQQTVADARHAVEKVGGEVSRIVDSLRGVSEAAGQISQIALQTRLLAFNASVEAKRAGDAGRGFAVVADAVRDLAGRVDASSQQIMGTMKQLDERVGALAREIQSRTGKAHEEHDGVVHRALASVDRKVARIQDATLASRNVCEGLRGEMGTIQDDMRQTTRSLTGAQGRTDTLLRISEQLLVVVAETGTDTPDTPFIAAVQAGAARVAKLLDTALQQGGIREADLFDENYVPIAGTEPQQHTTRFCALADRLFPEVQERMLELSPKVVFCIAVDRNGYVAAHNRKYSQPQRAGDTGWNAANSRYRRIFNDRTGLASASNLRPFLLQTYRRDMGGGKFVVMKEVASPIQVAGRHWGGLRLAYQF